MSAPTRSGGTAGGARTRGPVRVVGTGLLGTSIALGLRDAGVEVQLVDSSPTAAALARDVGAGELVTPASAPPGLVVVAVPPDVTAAAVVAHLQDHPGAVVTDVASVKAPVMDRVLDELARWDVDPQRQRAAAARYVGSHPLAGRERSGPTAGRADLFVARPWVLCPSPQATQAEFDAVRDLAVDLGASPVVMDADEHDQAVAVVSHVPQVAASLVAAQLLRASDGAVALAGQGLRDVTRIAASDPALWTQILGANAVPVLEVLDRLRDDLGRVIEALQGLGDEQRGVRPATGARAVLARTIVDGGAGRERIPGKHGSAPAAYAVVTVLVPDAPGQLARLLADVAEAGVNLEELSLEHAPGQQVGLAAVSVLPAVRGELEGALLARGWVLES